MRRLEYFIFAAMICAFGFAVQAAAPTATPTAANPAATNAPAATVPPPKSVFNEKLAGGKDPFFPNSARRGEKAPAPGVPQASPSVTLLSQLAIKYIAPNRDFVLINDKTLGIGEEGAVRVQSGRVRVKVIEIRENSALVQVEGNPERMEIKRRETF